MTNTTFISDKILREVASELQINFQFNLTSRSPLPEIAESARDLFADRNLQPRWSALLLTAKIAKAMFLGTVDQTKKHNS